MNTPTKPVEQKARELLAAEFDRHYPTETAKNIRAGNYSEHGSFAASIRAIIAALSTDEERIRREAFEEAAKVADMLGGVRDRLPLIEGNNAEAKFRRHNRGQHVRAATIAKAIRSLSTPSKGVG